MNRNGFTLVELLACLALLGAILGIGLYVTRGTLATTLSTLTDVSQREIYDASETYVLENGVSWINDGVEYACITVDNLVEKGYFNYDDVVSYRDKIIKIERNEESKVIDSVMFVDVCK